MATKTTREKAKKTTSSHDAQLRKHQQESTLWLFGITLILLGVLLVVNLINAASGTSEMVKGASTIDRPTTVNQELRSVEHMLRDIDQNDSTETLDLP